MRIQRQFFVLLALLVITGNLSLIAEATTLPAGVLRFVQTLDKTAKIRQDGLIAMPDGSLYLPVLPQDPTVDLNPTRITRQWLGKGNQPDLVQFNNNLFLMRFTKGSRGKLVSAKLPYPIELKEGLLPQDLKLPSNLVIPGELKIILGSVAYNSKTVDTPEWVDTAVSVYQPGTASNGVVPNRVSQVLPANQLYLADAATQQLVALNLDNGKPISKTDLGCMPSAMTPTPGGLLALVTCLNTNQFMVVDPITQQVRSQFATGQRPSAIMVVNEANIWVANRFDSFLTVYPLVPVLKEMTDREESSLTVENQQIPLTAAADMLMPGVSSTDVLAIDSASGSVFVVDVNNKAVSRSFKTQPSLSAATLFGGRLWTVSRSSTVAKGYNLKTGLEEKTVTIGKKPVSMVAGNQLYILCAEDHRIDVVDPEAGTVLTSVPLPEDSFAKQLLWNGKQLFAASPSTDQVFVINLDSYRVMDTWTGKGSVISFNVPPAPQQLEPITALATTVEPASDGKTPLIHKKNRKVKPDATKTGMQAEAGKTGLMDKMGNWFKL